MINVVVAHWLAQLAALLPKATDQVGTNVVIPLLLVLDEECLDLRTVTADRIQEPELAATVETVELELREDDR